MKRFEKFIEKTSTCWLWAGNCDVRGYGTFRLGSSKIGAHRMAYELWVGEIPLGRLICHTCDVRSCVNPEHLFVGSISDNITDMWMKGRGQKGSERPNSKLTEEKVSAIKKRLASGEYPSQDALAAEFGVRQSVISRIKSGHIWKHIP